LAAGESLRKTAFSYGEKFSHATCFLHATKRADRESPLGHRDRPVERPCRNHEIISWEYGGSHRNSKETPSKPSWPSGLVGLIKTPCSTKIRAVDRTGSKRCDREFIAPALRRQTAFSYAREFWARAIHHSKTVSAEISARPQPQPKRKQGRKSGAEKCPLPGEQRTPCTAADRFNEKTQRSRRTWRGYEPQPKKNGQKNGGRKNGSAGSTPKLND